jgi:hypothetical protein
MCGAEFRILPRTYGILTLDMRMFSRRPMLLVVAVLLLVSAFIGNVVYARLIVPAAPLNFDEAAHSLPGYYVLRDLRAFDAHALWADFHIQTLWPPMFSLLQAPFLGLLGYSDANARLFAYLMLVGAALIACRVVYEIDAQLAPLAGLVSGLLALSAPGWLFVGSWAMQETPVAFMTLATFAVFLRALNTATRHTFWFALTGVMLIGLFLTKYNYAAFALVAIGIVDLAVRIRARRAAPATFVSLYTPVLLGLLGWFFTGSEVAPTAVKWRDFAFFVSNENSGLPFWSADNLLFYVHAAADWLMPHPLVFAVVLLTAGYAVYRVRRPGIALLAIFFLLGFVLATAHPLKSQRYITPIFPALWALSGMGGAAWALQPAQRLRIRALVIGITAIALTSWLIWVPRMQPVWAGANARDMRAAGDLVVRWQDSARPLLIIGTFGEMGPPYFEWRLRPLPGFANTRLPVNYDAPPVEGDDDIARVRLWLTQHPGAQVTLIDVGEASALFKTNDMQQKNLWKQKIVKRFSEIEGYMLIDSASYPESDLRVSYFLPKQ